MDMTFREKSVWACLVTTVLIYGVYFILAVAMYRAGEADGITFLVAFALAVATQVVALIVLHIVLGAFAARSSPGREDERDHAIERRSNRNAHIILTCGVLATIGLLVQRSILSAGSQEGAGAASSSLDGFMVGHALLVCFILSEVVHYGTQLLYYRRGW
ncbi:MAG: hypothetical protein ACYTHJ_03275 [Planctomycetota bacterium]|jgi:hypothetical protein